MKIAFYVTNSNISSVDVSNVEYGNPGIGGSEYSAILIITLLSKLKLYEIVLLCDSPGIFPKEVIWKACNDIDGAVQHCESNSFEFLVLDSKLITKNFLINYRNIKFIAWANCFLDSKQLDLFSKQPNLVRIVNVSKKQFEISKNHSISQKSCFIFNAVPSKFLDNYNYQIIPNRFREPNVVYIGSLISSKGFHILAKIWPEVIKVVPNAKLFVIGSGKLYGRNAKVGKWGIAEKKYESLFMKYLTSIDGKMLESVSFMGILGLEKYDLLRKCKVGVPNPSGISETFGYTAVEMQLMDCLVTTIDCPAYRDTVYDKSSLYSNVDELKDFLIQHLLSQKDLHTEMLNYINEFSVDKITSEWVRFFSKLANSNIDINSKYNTLNFLVTSSLYSINKSYKKTKKTLKSFIYNL